MTAFGIRISKDLRKHGRFVSDTVNIFVEFPRHRFFWSQRLIIILGPVHNGLALTSFERRKIAKVHTFLTDERCYTIAFKELVGLQFVSIITQSTCVTKCIIWITRQCEIPAQSIKKMIYCKFSRYTFQFISHLGKEKWRTLKKVKIYHARNKKRERYLW